MNLYFVYLILSLSILLAQVGEPQDSTSPAEDAVSEANSEFPEYSLPLAPAESDGESDRGFQEFFDSLAAETPESTEESHPTTPKPETESQSIPQSNPDSPSDEAIQSEQVAFQLKDDLFVGRKFWGNVTGTVDDAPEKVDQSSQSTSGQNRNAGNVTIHGNAGPVNAVACVPNSDFMICGTSNRQIILWNKSSGKELRRYNGSRASVTSIYASPAGDYFLSCSEDRRGLTWEVGNDYSIRQYAELQYDPKTISANADFSKIIIGCMDGSIAVYDDLTPVDRRKSQTISETNLQFRSIKGHLLAVNTVKFSRDGKFFLSAGDDRTVAVWNARSMEKAITLRGHSAAVLCADFSPDGNFVVSAGADKKAIVWEIGSQQIKHQLTGHVGDITGVKYSSDGTQIMTASKDRTAIIWDAQTGKILSASKRVESPILCADWDIENENVVVGCLNGSMEILAVSSFEKDTQTTISLPGTPTTASESSSGSKVDPPWVVSGELDKLQRGKNLFRFGRTGNYSDCGTISADGTTFVIVNSNQNDGSVWNVDTGKSVKLLNTTISVCTASFHPTDKSVLLTGSRAGSVQFWDAALDKVTLNVEAHKSAVKKIVFSGNGSLAVSGAIDGSIILWDVAAKKKIGVLLEKGPRINSLALSRDGTILAVARTDLKIGLWNLKTKVEKNLEGADSESLALAFTPNGSYLVSGSTSGKAYLWNLKTGKIIQEYIGHNGSILSVAISPDGSYVLTGGKQEEFSLIWRLEKANPIMILPYQGGGVEDVLFHPGKLIVITVGGRTPIEWDISEIRNIK